MTIKLTTHSLYLGFYEDRANVNPDGPNYIVFVASLSLSDDELKDHFRLVVCPAELDCVLPKYAELEIVELRDALDYTDLTRWNITTSPIEHD